MKKRFLSCFILCGVLLLSSLGFAGCGKSATPKGYTAVRSIEYQTINGSTKSKSYYEIEYEESVQITEEEYNNLDCHTVYDLNNVEMDAKKEPFYYKEGQVLKYHPRSDEYYSTKLTSIKEKYVYVKVCDDNKIEIIDTNNNHILVCTPYFEIEYFI